MPCMTASPRSDSSSPADASTRLIRRALGYPPSPSAFDHLPWQMLKNSATVKTEPVKTELENANPTDTVVADTSLDSIHSSGKTEKRSKKIASKKGKGKQSIEVAKKPKDEEPELNNTGSPIGSEQPPPPATKHQPEKETPESIAAGADEELRREIATYGDILSYRQWLHLCSNANAPENSYEELAKKCDCRESVCMVALTSIMRMQTIPESRVEAIKRHYRKQLEAKLGITTNAAKPAETAPVVPSVSEAEPVSEEPTASQSSMQLRAKRRRPAAFSPDVEAKRTHSTNAKASNTVSTAKRHVNSSELLPLTSDD